MDFVQFIAAIGDKYFLSQNACFSQKLNMNGQFRTV